MIEEEEEVAPQREVDHMVVDREVIEATIEVIKMIGIIEVIETIEMIETIEALRKGLMIEDQS